MNDFVDETVIPTVSKRKDLVDTSWTQIDLNGENDAAFGFLKTLFHFVLGQLKLHDRTSHRVVLAKETKVLIAQIFDTDRLQLSYEFKLSLNVEKLDHGMVKTGRVDRLDLQMTKCVLVMTAIRFDLIF